MRTRARAALAAAALALALPGLALAAKVGETLYVKAKNTRVMASPSPTSDAVAILQPGEQVKWEGADPANKQWHRVTAPGGKKGFVFQTNLSTQQPNMELVTEKNGAQSKVNAAKFATSGAAVKALSPGAEKYGREKQGSYKDAVEDIKALEELARKVTPRDLADHVAQAGLFPVVGPKDTVAPAKGSTRTGAKTKGGK